MLTQEKKYQQSKCSTFFSFCMTTSIVMRPWSAQHVNLNLLSLKEPIVTKVGFKTFVTHIIKLYNFPNTSGESIFQIALESLQRRTQSI